VRILSLIAIAGLASTLLLPQLGMAQTAPQQGPGWFVPGQSHPAAAPIAPRPAPAPQPPRPVQAAAPPPIPQLPLLPKAKPPPAAIMGVLSVPDVYRQSTAVQEVEKVINARREALNRDAVKEQGVWRQMQASLAHDRPKLTPQQIRAREAALQDRITKAQKEFSGRNQQIQEAAQVAIGEVNRMLIAVIRQVAESHGMNLVLHLEQVALNMNAFDITDEVAKELNKMLPSVTIPPDSAMPIGPPGTDVPAPVAGAGIPAPLPIPPAPAADAPKR
jgi:Skp family chaperone for outer membrane proteins